MPSRKAPPRSRAKAAKPKRARGGQPIPLTPERIAAFCAALVESCQVGKACKAISVSRTWAYDQREAHPEFAQAWDIAMGRGLSTLEDEAHRRAFDGVEEPVFHLGAKVASVQKYSDTLAIFLLKAHAPQKYRERADVNLTATVTLADLVLGAGQPPKAAT